MFRRREAGEPMRILLPALAGALGWCGVAGSGFAEAGWCADLERVADLAATNKLAYIAGAPREGNFSDTTLPLAGWRTCSLYGARTYTCDSHALRTAGDAETALAALVAEVKKCLGADWGKDDSRSSPVYVVVRNERDALSMTLSTDQADNGEHVVRLTLFVRGR
jgi:hypothetical protein